MPASPLRALADVDVRPARYALRAWLIAFVPSLALLLLRAALGDATLRPARAIDLETVVTSVVAAPIVESALMLGAAWLLARGLPGRPLAQAIAVAAAFALAHVPGGGLRQALAVAWPLFVYASVVVAWRARSPAIAFTIATAVHAAYNASFLALGAAARLAMPR